MRLQKSSLCRGSLFFLFFLLISVGKTFAKEKSPDPNRSSITDAKKFADTKKQALPYGAAGGEGKGRDEDCPEHTRRSNERSYKQRTSAASHIRPSTRLKAFHHIK